MYVLQKYDRSFWFLLLTLGWSVLYGMVKPPVKVEQPMRTAAHP
jgi:hypothetical protein